jgi:enamine deaminase RidA (YjgF/YER057c/UK114 family)
MTAERRVVPAQSPQAALVGYSRAVRVGNHIAVAGTAPIFADGSCPDDAYQQARRCLEIIGAALADLDASPLDVVRTRVFITNPDDYEAIGTAHGEMFSVARPATSMVVVSALLDPRWKVEIEAEAIVID